MEKIILFGTGRGLAKVKKILDEVKAFEVFEIWDNDPKQWGKQISVNGQYIGVMGPHKLNENIPVIITTTYYFEEIEEQLKEQFLIESSYIRRWNYCLRTIKEEIIRKYANNDSVEIKGILDYIEKHDLNVFNQDFQNRYNMENARYKIERDNEIGLLYSYWHGKKLFFKRSLRTEKVAKSYLLSIAREQDVDSPHNYMQPGYEIRDNEVVVDGGAAEGFFALDCVDKAKKVFIIEGDSEWLEALHYTFEPYKDKVEIIPKWLGATTDEKQISLDKINEQDKISFIKLDVEGAELEVLQGAKQLLEDNTEVKVLACAYHNGGDAEALSNFFLNIGCEVRYSRGYMFFPYGEHIIPELRRGIVLAKKKA